MAQGSAALAALQRVFGELHATKQKLEAPEILQRLLQLVSSVRILKVALVCAAGSVQQLIINASDPAA